MSDDLAEFSVADARALARMYREWTEFRRSMSGDVANEQEGSPIGVHAPQAYVLPKTAASVVIGSGGAFQWKYTGDVVVNPTGHKLTTPLTVLKANVTILNTCEFANTSTKVMGVTIYPSGASKCGDAIGCKPLTDNFLNVPLPASLYWVWFETNVRTTGYWAWHVTMPNQLTYNEDTSDTTR